jgi:hypothetical protein
LLCISDAGWLWWELYLAWLDRQLQVQMHLGAWGCGYAAGIFFSSYRVNDPWNRRPFWNVLEPPLVQRDHSQIFMKNNTGRFIRKVCNKNWDIWSHDHFTGVGESVTLI